MRDKLLSPVYPKRQKSSSLASALTLAIAADMSSRSTNSKATLVVLTALPFFGLLTNEAPGLLYLEAGALETAAEAEEEEEEEDEG